MPTLDGPLRLSNIFKPKIWGREELSPVFHVPPRPRGSASSAVPALARELIGEVWITDDASRFLNGPLAGMALGEAVTKHGPELCGQAWQGSRFPILAKFIFTNDWLSVQVHPDDGYARVHDPGNVGKCEMWYILRSERGAEILMGLKPGTTKEKMIEAFQAGTSPELLGRFHPRAGEAIFVPPGTVHSLGPGLVLFEVEENSDLTYRLDDFGRVGLDGKPRPLHWDKGLDVVRTEAPVRRAVPKLEFRESYGQRRYVLACRHFALEELTLRRVANFAGSPQRVEVLSVLGGEGRIENRAGWLACRGGDTWLIPPAAGQYRLAPREEMRLLRFYVPDLEEDFRRPLARRRVAAAKIGRIVFD